ncbi:MAG: glucosamine-6-phosphate deaminase [Cyclobacteriaceae bacterium]
MLDNKIANSTNQYEKIPVSVFSESIEASVAIANEIATSIKAKEKLGEVCVLGLATGSSPKNVYGELVRMHKEEGLSFKNVVTFNLDEYYPMKPDSAQSYVRFMNEHLFDHIDIDKSNINIPDGTIGIDEVETFCDEYEKKIDNVGGLDFQLLGIGRTGHIGFNEPGSSIKSKTRLIKLDHITKIDAASDFFGEENVPDKAITMGVGTILKAKRILLMAWGEGKSSILKKTIEGEPTSSIPATFLQEHTNTTFILDEAASAALVRSKEPWLFHKCSWTDDLIKKALITLCEKLGKPILKLTERDYVDNGLTDLISEHGSAYDLNIKVFNEIQHTITGWPGGKPNADDANRPERKYPEKKRVLIFSPHPDDDVISMGGTLIRLHDQGHEVHVAYQTSGNIAVSDEDVISFSEFVSDYQSAFSFESSKENELFNKVLAELKTKKAGESDSPDVRKIKGLIRRVEAKSACRYVGLNMDHVYHQDLPFYETGLVKKNPIGDEDINLTVDLIKKIKPHQIYAAGDLSDPHGTHRVCLDAVFQSLYRLKNEDWMKECWVWLYRGAWQEWETEKIEMAVPISPEELMRKRRAIFKHQSQKDRPLFPGTDSREFWQRSEQRNRATAQAYDKLGLAEYEAIEAFKRYQF